MLNTASSSATLHSNADKRPLTACEKCYCVQPMLTTPALPAPSPTAQHLTSPARTYAPPTPAPATPHKLFPSGYRATADVKPAGTARTLVSDYPPESLDATAGTASPWLNPALLLDAPGSVCDGDWPVAPGDFCTLPDWNALHLRRRAGLVLVLAAWWLLLAAGAGGGRH